MATYKRSVHTSQVLLKWKNSSIDLIRLSGFTTALRKRIICEDTYSPLYRTGANPCKSTKKIGYVLILLKNDLQSLVVCQQFTAAQYTCEKKTNSFRLVNHYATNLVRQKFVYLFVEVSARGLKLRTSLLTVGVPRRVQHQKYYIVFGSLQQSVVQFPFVEIVHPCVLSEERLWRWNTAYVALAGRKHMSRSKDWVYQPL